MEAFKPLIAKAAAGLPLSREEASLAFAQMLSGEVTPAQMAGFLMALRVRGESVEEITGAVSDIYGQGAKDAAGAAKRFFEEAGARFKASTSTNDVHYLLSEATKGQYALVALNKGNGSEVGTIPLGSNKEPQYEVDAITNTVYLLSGSEVRCFKP